MSPHISQNVSYVKVIKFIELNTYKKKQNKNISKDYLEFLKTAKIVKNII